MFGDDSPPAPPQKIGDEEEASALSYEAYREWRNVLLEGRQSARRSLDRASAVGAGSALALTVTFLSEIAPDPLPATLQLVRWGWVALIVALGLGLFSYFTSERAYATAVEGADEWYDNGGDGEDPPVSVGGGWWNDATRLLNLASLASLVLGVSLVTVFAWKNLSARATEEVTDEQRQEQTEVPSTAAHIPSTTEAGDGAGPEG